MRIVVLVILVGLVYVLWNTNKVTDAVSEFSDTTNQVIQSQDNFNNSSSKNLNNQGQFGESPLDSASNSTAREIAKDPVGFINVSLNRLNEGKRRLEDSLFDQKVLITRLERQQESDRKAVERHTRDLKTWKTAFENNQFNTEQTPFSKKQLTQIIKDTYKRRIALTAEDSNGNTRFDKYANFLVNSRGFVIELENQIERLEDQILTLEMEKGMVQVLSTDQGIEQVRSTVNTILDRTSTLSDYGSKLSLEAASNVQSAANYNSASTLEDIFSEID